MMKKTSTSVLTLFLLSAAACSDGGDLPEGTGGGAGAGGALTGIGGGASGGQFNMNSGGQLSGGSTSGGATSSGGAGGSATSGGASGGGSLLGVGGRVVSDGGASGDSGGSGSGGEAVGSGGTDPGGKAPVDPSSGCGVTGSQVGSSGGPMSIGQNQYYLVLPQGYDENTAYPTIFMFHPTGNPLSWAEDNSGFKDTDANSQAIMVYPGSRGSGWEAADVDFFDPLYTAVTENFCVDKARVFAAGESSGGDYSSILGCEFGDKIRAIGPCATKPVGAYPLNVGQRSCKGDVAPIVIHGMNDNVVGPENGPATRDFYVELNGCNGASSQPVDGYTDTLSNCVQYEGCKEGSPVIFCQHTDPEYNNTNHGWPKFAGKMLWEQFSSY